MNNEYRVEASGNAFIVVDPAGEQMNTRTARKRKHKRTSNAASVKTPRTKRRSNWWTFPSRR
jgi:hypothetical protein